MTKLVGILMISVAFGIVGHECTTRLRARARSLKAFVKFFDSLGARIGAFAIPFNDFISDYSDDLIGCGSDFAAVCKSSDFSSAVRECAHDLALDDADIKLLSDFGDGFGTLDLARETKRCAYYGGECEKLLCELEEKLPLKARLYNSLGITCAILAAVIFV